MLHVVVKFCEAETTLGGVCSLCRLLKKLLIMIKQLWTLHHATLETRN
jgi:hypothetical protein